MAVTDRINYYGTTSGVTLEIQGALKLGTTGGVNRTITYDTTDAIDKLKEVSDVIDGRLINLYSVPLRKTYQSAEETTKRYPYPIDFMANKLAAAEILRSKYTEQSEVNANMLADGLAQEAESLLQMILTHEI